jgi:YD repeat-containing protein
MIRLLLSFIFALCAGQSFAHTPVSGAVARQSISHIMPPAVAYDADGNLLSDSRWAYTWDAVNHLVSTTSHLGSSAPNSVRNELIKDAADKFKSQMNNPFFVMGFAAGAVKNLGLEDAIFVQ